MGLHYIYKESRLSDGSYRDVEFGLAMKDVRAICHSGPNDWDVREAVKQDYVKEQLSKLSDDFLRGVARSYGLEVENYETREDLEHFLVWSVAWDIFEEEAA